MKLTTFQMLATLASPFFVPSLASSPNPAMPLPSKTREMSEHTASLTPMERCGLSGCIMTGKDPNGKPIFKGGAGCDHCNDDLMASQAPQQQARKRTKRGAATSMNAMESCGMRGCIMTGKASDGRPLFAGLGCDHCADEWVAPRTTSVTIDVPAPQTPIATSTVIAVERSTVTVTSVVILTAVVTTLQTQVVLSTSIEQAYAIRTSWTTQTTTATSTVTTTATTTATTTTTSTATTTATVTNVATSGQEPAEGCLRIGTLDQGGALWSGKACDGDATYSQNEGCSRAGTLDAGGALWVGDECGTSGKQK